jgi:hypothetical protein
MSLSKMFSTGETSGSNKRDAFLTGTDAEPPKQSSKMLSSQGFNARTWTTWKGKKNHKVTKAACKKNKS